MMWMTDLSAADNKDFLVADLPGKDQRAAALNVFELGHAECVRGRASEKFLTHDYG
jgi:hypothetical protein